VMLDLAATPGLNPELPPQDIALLREAHAIAKDRIFDQLSGHVSRPNVLALEQMCKTLDQERVKSAYAAREPP
jgi:hypothetical protein